VADDKIKIEIDVETRSAIADLAKLAKATEQVEKQTEKLTAAQRAWKLANTDIGKLAGGWKEAGESIAKVATAFGGLAVAGVAVAAAAERQENALRRLGSAYDAVSVATNGAFSAQQALTLQGQIQAAGVRVNAEQLGLLTRAAREYALATGNDASEAVEKLTNAIVNNSEDALSELNLAQARATTSTQTLANVTRALEERFRGVAPAARTLNEDLAKLPDVLTHIGNLATQAAAGGLTRLIDAFNGAGAAARTWRDIVELADTDRTMQRQAAATAEANRRSALREQIQRQAQAAGARFSMDDIQGLNTRQLESVSRRLETGFGTRGRSAAGSDLGAAFSAILAQQDRGIDSTRAVGGIIAAVRDEEAQRARRAAMGEARPVSDAERAKDEIAKRLANGGSGDSLRGPQRDYNRALSAAVVLGAPIVTVERARGQTLEEYWQARTAAQTISNEMTQRTRDAQRQEGARFLETTRALRSSDDLTDAGITLDEMRRQLMPLMVEAAGGLNPLNDRQSLRSVLGIAGESGDSLNSMLGDIADAQEGGGLMAREERARRSRIATRNQGTRRMAREQSLGGRVAGSLGFGTDAEGRISPFDGMQAGAELLTGTVNSLTSGLTSLFDTLVSGSADAGTAFQAFASGLLTELGKMAVNKGLFYTFEGIAALFSAPPAAPAYFAAGAGLLALGAGLGIAGAATRPQTPAPGTDVSTARGLAPRSSNSGASTRDLAPVTVVMSSLVPAGPNDARRVRSGLDDARRRGFAGNNAPRRVEY